MSSYGLAPATYGAGGYGADIAMPRPMYSSAQRVQVGWQGSTAGLFLIGSSTLVATDTSPGDTIGTSVPSGFVAADDMTSRCILAEGRSGRDSNQGDMAMGTATLTFTDPKRELDPRNPASPFYGFLELRRPVLVEAYTNGAWYPLFRGFVRKISPRPQFGVKQTILECVDLYWILNRERPIIAPTSGHTTGSAISAIHTAIGFTDPLFIDFDVGSPLPGNWPHASLPADGTRTALQLIADLLVVEQGIYFVTRGGVATFTDRHNLHSPPESATHNLADLFTYVEGDPELELVRNRARVMRTGGMMQERIDQASIDVYGPADFDMIESPYLASDDDAGALAGHLVLHHKDPRPPVWSLPLDSAADEKVLMALLEADIRHHVEIADELTGQSGMHHIESQSWRMESVGQGEAHHTGAWSLSKVPDHHPFQVGVSGLDGPHVVVY